MAHVSWPSTHDGSPEAIAAAWSPAYKAARCLRRADIWRYLWGRRRSVMVQQSSSAARAARHPTPECRARWAPCGHHWRVSGSLMEKTYHILLRLPRLS